MQIKVLRLSEFAKMPVSATEGAACFDIHATNRDPVIVTQDKPHVFSTGLSFEIPAGHVMLVFSRSGHAFRNNLRLANSVGVIDADYRGELRIKLAADGYAYTVMPGERIAQLMVLPLPTVSFVESDYLLSTQRGSNGFGSTGT